MRNTLPEASADQGSTLEATPPISDEYIHALFERVKSWGRWGKDDELGTLNYLTPAHRKRATRLVKSGVSISCARDFPVTPAPENPMPALHHMVIGGDDPCAAGVPGMEVSTDFIGIMFHGLASTHIDALCHVFVDGVMYNGFSALDVKSTGARRNAISHLKDGIVGRGVLLDVPGAMGRDYIDPSDRITISDLERAEQMARLEVGVADILMISTGRDRREALLAPDDAERARLAGLHPECIEWFHERQISVLASDAAHDPMPPGKHSEEWPIPIHMCALAGMGLHLIDNLRLDRLLEQCRARDQWAFLFSAAPLPIQGGTGSPINPLALF